MRIKKKNVIKESLLLEGLLIDELNMDPFDKKALKALHKRFNGVSIWDIDTDELTDELHEMWLMPLSKAINIVNTYIYKRNHLFKEYNLIENIKNAEIFRRYGRKFFRKYRESLEDDNIMPEGVYWDVRFGDGTSLPYEPSFWSSWDGYTLYFTVGWEYRWDMRFEYDTNSWNEFNIVISVDFNWDDDVFDVKYKVGQDDNKQYGIIVDNQPIKYPEGEITYESGTDWVENHVMNVVKPLIQQFTFPFVSKR